MPQHRYDLTDAVRLSRRLTAALERLQDSPDAADGREALEAVDTLREAVHGAVVDALVEVLGGVLETGARWGATAAARALGIPLRTLQHWRARNVLRSTENSADRC